MMSCKEADINHYVEESAAASQTKCSDGYNQPEIGMTSCIKDEATIPMLAIVAGVGILVIAGIFMQSQKPKSSQKRRKRKPRKGKRRPPQGKRKRRKPAPVPSTEASQEEE